MRDLFEGAGGGGGSSSPSREPDNLLSQDYVEIILGLCKGPIKGIVSQPSPHGPLENFFFGETSLVNQADQTPNFKDFKVTQYKGDADDPPIERVMGGDASNVGVGTHLQQNTPVTRTTSTSLRKTADFAGLDRLEIRILFNTILEQNDEGTFNAHAHLKIEYKASNISTWSLYDNKPDIDVYGKTTSGYVKDFLIDVEPLTNADYDIRVTKLSPDNGTSIAIDMTWESIQAVVLGRPSYPGLAKIHIYGKSSNQFSSIPDMSSICEGMIVSVPTNYNPDTRIYDESIPWNGTFKNAYTNNPAWILYWLITDTDEGLAHYYKNVSANRGEFYTAGKWCDEQVPSGEVGVTQPRFTFNEYVDTQRLGLEFLTYVAGAFNSTIYDGGNGIVRLKTDRPTTPKQIFTPENISIEGFNYTFTDITTRYNEITVQFVNPAFNWNTDERLANIDASDWVEQNGIIPFSFLAVGCTDVHEAVRRANDRLLTCNTEVTTVMFETTRFGFLAELYDTIMIADPVSGWSTGGRIKSYSNGTIQLRDPIFFESQLPVNITIQTYSGLVTIGVTPPSTGLVYSLSVVSGIYPANNVPDRTVFTVENESNLGLSKPFKVMAIVEVEGNPDRYQITALEINPDKYEDSANGTKSDPVTYDFTTPGEPKMPVGWAVENELPITTSDGTLIFRARASWVRPFQAYTDHYEVDYTLEASGVWTTQSVFGDEIELKPLKDQSYYEFRLFGVTPTGARTSKPLITPHFQVASKIAILENVTGLNLVQTNKGWQASWSGPVNVPDLAGTRIKFSNPPKTWEELPNLYLSPSLTQDLPWFTAGSVRIHAKYINTSNNESADSAVYNLTVLAPSAPQVTVSSSFGSNILTFTDPMTTQPLSQILVKKGSATSTWDNAAISSFTLGTNQRTFSVSPDATQATRVFLRAVDVAGNQGAITLVEIAPGANSVQELLDAVKGDIDETWITPGLLDHINYGDPEVAGGLADQINQIKKVNAQFESFYTQNWKNSNPGVGWLYIGGNSGDSAQGVILNSTTNDPTLTSPNVALNGRLYDKLRVNIKRTGGTTWDGSVFYSNVNHGQSANYSVHFPDTTILNEWVVIDIDMSILTDWTTSTAISGIRFDFGGAAGDNFIVEYISFGRYGVGVTQAEFKNEITVRANADTAFAQQLTTISASVNRVGDVINPDPGTTNLLSWDFGGQPGATITQSNVSDAPAGVSVFTITGQSELQTKGYFDTSSGRNYRISSWLRRLSSEAKGCYIRIHFYDSQNNLLQYVTNNQQGENLALSLAWSNFTGYTQAPVNAVKMKVVMTFNYPGGTNATQIQDIRLQDITVATALVQTESTVRASETGYLGAQWATRVSLTGPTGAPVIGGIAIAGTNSGNAGPVFDFSVRSNKIAFLPPAGLSADTPTYPFVYYTTATVLPSGLTVQPGLYTKNAFIEYVTADQIDTRGLTVKDYSGNILFGVAKNLDFSRITAASDWLNANTQWAQVNNRPISGGSNLLNKGNFEDGKLGYWTNSGVGANGEYNGPQGSYNWINCLQVYGRDNFEQIPDLIPIDTPNQIFYLEGDGNAGASGYNTMFSVAFMDANTNVIAYPDIPSMRISPSPGWFHVKGSIVAPAGARYARAWIQIGKTGGTPSAPAGWANLYLGKVEQNATNGATWGVNVNGDGKPTTGINLIQNGTFESGIQDWALKHSQNDAAVITAVNTSDAFAGAGVLQISGNAACVSSRAIGVTPGGKYRVTIRYRALAGNVEPYFYTALSVAKPTDGYNGYPDSELWSALPGFEQSTLIGVSSAWQTYDQVVTIPGNYRWLSLGLHRWFRSATGAVLQIDDVVVTNYTGDLNATNGAPTGTSVGGVEASQVISNINLALDSINTIASDSVLSPGDKPTIIQLWQAIAVSQAPNNNAANTYGIVNDKNNYNNSIANLAAYLNSLGPYGWSDLNGNTNVDGPTLRSCFSNVYSTEQTLKSTVAALAGTTSTWGGVSGGGKPQDNATVGATFGVNVFGKITSGNASTFIDNAAINYAMIQYILASQISTTSLSAISATIGTLRTATSGARTEIRDNYWAIYNSSNLAVIELGIF